MRNILIFSLLSLIKMALFADLAINTQCESVVLMDADTKAVIYAKDPHKKLFPASVTKIAIAYHALTLCSDKLNTLIEAKHDAVCSISKEERVKTNYNYPAWWLEKDTQHMGIKKGEELTLYDLLQGNLVVSAGDASNVIAQYIGGSVGEYMPHLNRFLKEKGLNNTHFKNPHGVHHPEHVSTAYDMAKLMAYCIEEEDFLRIIQQKSYKRPKTNKQDEVTLSQTNRLICPRKKHYYPYAIGGKTGYTKSAGHTLVAVAKKGNRTLVISLFNAKERDALFEEAIKIFEKAFSEEKVEKLYLSTGVQQLARKIPGANKPLTTYTYKPLIYDYYPYEKQDVVCYLTWDTLSLPIKEKDKVGSVYLATPEGKKVASVSLYADKRIDKSRITLFKEHVAAHLFLYTLLLIAFFAMFLFFATRF